jgi:hypothetical protein
MLKRYSIGMAKKKGDHDFSIRASRVVEQATKDTETIQVESIQIEGKNPNAVALGRLGGLKGGKARFDKLTPQQRREIAQRAAQARWHHKSNPH